MFSRTFRGLVSEQTTASLLQMLLDPVLPVASDKIRYNLFGKCTRDLVAQRIAEAFSVSAESRLDQKAMCCCA
jgi:hypothetical protein